MLKMCTKSNSRIRLPITTTVSLSNEVVLDILNVAINGGCESWAHVAEKKTGVDGHMYISAIFTSRDDAAVRRTVTGKEVATGIQRILAGDFPIAARVKERVLRIVANDDASEVDMEVAAGIVRAAVMGGPPIRIAWNALALCRGRVNRPAEHQCP